MGFQFKYVPEELARKIASELNLDHWRAKIAAERDVSRWSNIFANRSPSEKIIPITAQLIAATQGGIAADFIYAMILAAYTYGFADACAGLADEEFMLFSGEPLDFPSLDNPGNEPRRGNYQDYLAWVDGMPTPEREPVEPQDDGTVS